MIKKDALIIIRNGLHKHIHNLIKSTNILWKQTSYIPKKLIVNFNEIKDKVKVSGNDIIDGNLRIGWQGINSTKVPEGSMIIDFDKYVNWKYGDWNVDELKARFPEFITNEKYYKKGGKVKRTTKRLPVSERKMTFYNQDKEADANRPAKPKGWRIAGKHKRSYDKPTKKEIEKGYAVVIGKKYKVYTESRSDHSDYQPKSKIKLAEGGVTESQEKKYNYFYNKMPISKTQFEKAVPTDWKKDVDEMGEYSWGYYRAIETIVTNDEYYKLEKGGCTKKAEQELKTDDIKLRSEWIKKGKSSKIIYRVLKVNNNNINFYNTRSLRHYDLTIDDFLNQYKPKSRVVKPNKKEEGGLTDRYVLFYDSGTGNADTEFGKYSNPIDAKEKAQNLINKDITDKVKVFDEVNNIIVYSEEYGMISDFSESHIQKQVAEAGMYIQPMPIFLKTGGKIPFRITVERFRQILGHEPDYPYEYYKGKKYIKRFLQPFYERTK